jgi:hypothetical protein
MNEGHLMPRTPHSNIENKEVSSFSQKDLDRIFEANPDIQEIGTEEQYAQYLKTIFPKSSVEEIVWHGSLSNIAGDFRDNQHFGSLEAAKSRNGFKKQAIGDFNLQEYYYPALLNIKNLKRTRDADYAWEKEIADAKSENFDGIVYLNNNEGSNKDSYLVFGPEQIHVLGTKDDLEKFKEFAKK